MSYRGGMTDFQNQRRGGGFRSRGRPSRGARDSYGKWEQGPPEQVIPLGFYVYPCQSDLICKVEIDDVPFFNAPIYLENKVVIGKIDEIFGNVKDYFVSIRLNENFQAGSFEKNAKLYIDPAKILPLSRFLTSGPAGKRGRGDGRGGGRGRGFGGRGGRGRGGTFGRGGGGGGGFQGRGGGRGRGFGGRGGGAFRGRGGPPRRW